MYSITTFQLTTVKFINLLRLDQDGMILEVHIYAFFIYQIWQMFFVWTLFLQNVAVFIANDLSIQITSF